MQPETCVLLGKWNWFTFGLLRIQQARYFLLCYSNLLAFVCILVTKLCLLIGVCNRGMWLIDWLIDSLTGATVGCCPLRGKIYPLFPLVCLHTSILLSVLNIPSYLLSSGPFCFLSAPLLSLLFRSVLSSILLPVPLFTLLFYLFSHVMFYPHFFL